MGPADRMNSLLSPRVDKLTTRPGLSRADRPSTPSCLKIPHCRPQFAAKSNLSTAGDKKSASCGSKGLSLGNKPWAQLSIGLCFGLGEEQERQKTAGQTRHAAPMRNNTLIDNVRPVEGLGPGRLRVNDLIEGQEEFEVRGNPASIPRAQVKVSRFPSRDYPVVLWSPWA